MNRSQRFFYGIVMLVSLLTGCGKSGNYVPVSGTVYLDDKPLPNVMVTFQPVASSGNDAQGVGSFGMTDASGRYQLEVSSLQKQMGALVGKHIVRIATPPPKGGNNDDSDSAATPKNKKDFQDPIPARYNTESTLTFEVPPGGTQSADFKLTR